MKQMDRESREDVVPLLQVSEHHLLSPEEVQEEDKGGNVFFSHKKKVFHFLSHLES